MIKRIFTMAVGLLAGCNGFAAVYNLSINSGGVPVLPTNTALVRATNKGDILVGAGTNLARQAVGANGLVLTADSAASNGVAWAAAGAGTVMSVGLAAASPLFGVSNSPITVTGDITLTNTYQASNSVLAGPVSGTNAAPTFRHLVAADVPQLAATKTGTGAVDDTEFGYLDGVTSGIQGQINAKLDSTTAEAISLSADEFYMPALSATNALLGVGWDYKVHLVPGPTWAEAGYLAGVTSALQTQLDRRGLSLLGQLTNLWLWGNLNMTNVGGYGLSTDWDGPDMMLYGRNPTESAAIANVNVLGGGLGGVNIYMPLYFNSGLTASRVLVLDGSSKLTSSSVTTTELDYLGGITGRPMTTNAFAAKGDILSFSGLSLTRLPLGGNGQVLSVDNSTSTGLRWLTVGGIGTVTSVGISGTAEIGVSGSPITAAGTIVLTNAYQAANTVFAGPASGTNTTPAFRSLVAADMPTGIDATKIADGSVNNAMLQTIATLSLSLPNLNGVATNLSLRGAVTYPITTIQTDGTTNFSVNATNSWVYIACTNDVVITNAANLPATGYGTITMVTIDGGGVARKLWFAGAAAATNIHHLGDLKTTVPYLFTNRVMLSFAFGGPSLTNASVGVVKE